MVATTVVQFRRPPAGQRGLYQALLDDAVCGVLRAQARGRWEVGWPCRQHDVRWLPLGPLDQARRALRAQQRMTAWISGACAAGVCPFEEAECAQ